MGRPSIATDVEGSSELIESGHNGFLIPPRDSKALANKLLTLLEKPELLTSLSYRARLTALTYDWKTVAHGYLQLCEPLRAYENAS